MGGCFSFENEGKGGGGGKVGGGWVGDRERYRQVNAHAFVNTTLSLSTLWFLPERIARYEKYRCWAS